MQQACLYSTDPKILSPLHNLPASSRQARGEAVKVGSRWPFIVSGYRAMDLQATVGRPAEYLGSGGFVT